ncbi:hypothetical protein PTSG_08075 [Salpingoeca rosetta]|uniref:PH domain-containing protein n=1 Tax=Salpingoeca rosetta (strain ATCC 50818 / BSB-021) TaxID=946362 RepID=F2UHX5_SALR5|nr:uncharacterized protein PTSG_08075 [Salpingoeca rosetta]EGD76724.1 hypothetical protein PTSG_08075 [Salpingoeca rosetta]|eukprot:XP_004991096.1 hypothetical protein PTSG_08075 [Salpingoeca rosetta]
MSAPKQREATVKAVIFLANGDECRCIRMAETATIQDLVDHMLRVQDDWAEINVDGQKPLSFKAGEDSSTDDVRDRYAIVEVCTPAGGDAPRERFLPKDMRLDDPQMRPVRQAWERIMFRQLRAQFARAFGRSAQGQDNGKGKSKAAKKRAQQQRQQQQRQQREQLLQARRQAKGKGGKKGGASDYWFISPVPSNPKTQDVRLKFVDRDDYEVVKDKEGWLDVKENGKRRSRWVVYQEDTLMLYKDPDDDEPAFVLKDVADCEFNTKKAAPASRVLKLKSGIVDSIPEYTEEEEERDITEALSLAKLQRGAGDGGYLTIEQLKSGTSSSSKPTSAGTDDVEDVYLSLDDVDYDDVMMNEEGDYLTVDTLRELAEDAGYLSVDEMNRLANDQGDYLDVVAIRQLARDAGYLSVNEMRDLMEDDYMTVDEMHELATQ